MHSYAKSTYGFKKWAWEITQRFQHSKNLQGGALEVIPKERAVILIVLFIFGAFKV